MFSDYVKKLADVQKLAPAEEGELWRAYKERGDEAARRTIIESYQPLVFREVMPYRALPAVMDAVQEGTIGLIEAVERYDPTRGVAFSLYAVHRVRGRILDFLRREGRVDLPCLEAETEAYETAKELLVDERPSVAELAEHHALVGVLGAAMERLPARERLVLEGVTIGGARAQTMAESLGVTPAHIYRLQQNGIRRVRGMLSRFMQNW
ncbi:RNA polymerase subunit sigma-70 [Selenomonas sp. oral taxon 126]|uniref:sigma-70 family RNA polymerase sigma factor n=1 Tax=Selenomonas sp. oral taxon 126 TaxID=712528 RepID=UPI00080787F5|nr:sigma-70 family RNA polymerase sigma factor [Selenomonas sp. oral taxon 126]ANR69764.1 RNA polymerase subunit sigma-70 [Selenomonas sp. oral taxon 126]